MFWRIQLAIWALYGVIHFLAALPVVAPEDRPTMAIIKLVRAITGFGASALLWPLYRRMVRLGPGRVAVIALVASAAASQLWFTVDRALLVSLIGLAGLEVDWDWFPRGLELDYIFVLVAWSAGFLVVYYSREAAARQRQGLERELALRDAQLKALSYQLSPHFLFNALNSIRSLIAEDTGRAREMVTRLSQFLNATLDAGNATTLADELKTIRAYLAIQEVRFEAAMKVEIEASAEAARCPVPTLCLQPLVENAVQHGARGDGRPLCIRVSAEMKGERLRITVANTGTLAQPAGADRREGVGLGNTRARLARFYESEPSLRLAQDGNWVRAEIEVDHPERVACAR
jgi:hypothetical protein